jgi:hypothetical protein
VPNKAVKFKKKLKVIMIFCGALSKKIIIVRDNED